MSAAVISPPRCEVCDAALVQLQASLNAGRCRSCGLVSLLTKPSDEQIRALYDSPAGYAEYVAAARTESLQRRYALTLDRLSGLLASRPWRQVLFDVGAGDGAFLELATETGFDISGNEISAPARRLCEERLGIQLSDQVLEDQPGRDRFDAMTMWCVLAHVADPQMALEAVLRLLKPGGVLYFHTPTWCLIDTAGLALSRLSRGRFSQVTNRRIGPAHMRLYGEYSLTCLVRAVGFEVIDLRPKAAYSLQTQAYLQSMNVPRVVRAPLARGLDQLIDRDLFPRNVLVVYLRKPRAG